MAAFDAFEEWMKHIKNLCGEDFDHYSEWYSFKTAFESGMTPEQAYKDCAEWMNS